MTLSKPILESIRNESRDFIVYFAPSIVKRACELVIDKPIHRSMRDSPILFIHIPKNAGTNVATQLYGRHSGHHTAQWYRAADTAYFDSKHKFALLRHPYDRFISAYKFAWHGGTSSVRASRWITKLVRKYDKPFLFAQYLSEFHQSDLEKFDPVFQPQYSYICDRDGSLMIDTCMKLEDVSGSIIKVGDTELDLRNKVNKNRYEEVDDNEVKIENKMMSIIRRIYKTDFEWYEKINL